MSVNIKKNKAFIPLRIIQLNRPKSLPSNKAESLLFMKFRYFHH
jgi:hypothetical protein